MNRLKYKIQNFLRGRYGTDRLNKTLVWVYVAVLFVLLIVSFSGAPLVLNILLNLIAALLFVIIIARTFSRNIYKRQKENKAYLDFIKGIRDRIRDRKTHVYRKCPKCKAILRLPRAKGRHNVVCPRCKNRFRVRGKGIF